MSQVNEKQKGIFFRVNRNLIPLKLVIFFFNASAYSSMPYFSVHMKDLGLPIANIGVMFAIFSFATLVSVPLIGFLADKLGTYHRVISLLLAIDVVSTTLLLVVPHVRISSATDVSMVFEQDRLSVSWSGCDYCQAAVNTSLTLSLDRAVCQTTCANQTHSDCLLPPAAVSASVKSEHVGCSEASGRIGNALFGGQSVECSWPREQDFVRCLQVDFSYVLVNALYFVFCLLSTVSIQCIFNLIEVLAFQMCQQEESRTGQPAKVGQQFMFISMAQIIVSSTLGKFMDYVTSASGSQWIGYLVPFGTSAICLVITLLVMHCLMGDVQVTLPKNDALQGVRKIFTSLPIMFYLLLIFFLGTFYGFYKSFLFVFLKTELSSSMHLLGLTIAVGGVLSLPVLLVSDWIIQRVGELAMVIFAMFMYSARYTGYACIENPWMVLPFESLDVFTTQMMRVASVRYVGKNAPKGLVATLNGLVSSLHYGLGRGSGALLGGAIITATGSTRLTFKLFAVSALIIGLVYACVYSGLYLVKAAKGEHKIRVEAEEKSEQAVQG